MSDISPREPWPGYADLDEAARDELLRQEVPAGEGPERPGLRATHWPRRSRTTSSCSSCSPTRPPPSRSPRPRAACTTTPVRGSRASRHPERPALARDRDTTMASPRPTSATRRSRDRVDLRRPWHPIADQGETASCVGWAVADSVLRWQLVEAGRLAPDQRLSARHVWMSAKETDQRDEYPSTFLEADGTSLKAGLDVVRKFGVVLEAELPWEGRARDRRPDGVQQVGAAAPDHGLLQPRRRQRPRPQRPLPRVAPLAAPERPRARADRAGPQPPDHHRRARRASTPPRSRAATPPRCSATAPTTSCCARAGAPTGATRATRA